MRRGIYVSGLIAVLLLTTIVGGWLWREHDDASDRAIADARVVASTYAAHTERLLQSVDEINGEIGHWRQAAIPAAGIDELLRLRKTSAPHFMDLLLLDRDGAIQHWSGTGAKPRVTDRPYYRMHSEHSDVARFLDEPRPSRVHYGRWFFSYSRAITAADGSFDGVAVSILDAAIFDDALKAAAALSGITASLVHESGSLVADSLRSTARGEKINPLYWPSRQAKGRPIDDAHHLGWVEPVPGQPIGVVVRVDRDAALSDWHKRLIFGIFGLAIGSVGLLLLTLFQSRQATQLTEAEWRYRALAEQSLVGITILRNGEILYANPKIAELFGLDSASFPDSDPELLALVDPADRQRVKAQLRRWQTGEDWQHAITFAGVYCDGGRIEVEAQGRAVEIGGAPATLVMLSDITEKALARRQLQEMAYHDALTGLPNRSLFFDRLSHLLTRARRHNFEFALLLMDLDGFKTANDTFGHDAGDVVLQTVADRLRSCVRESDTVARMGGDEFLLLLETRGTRADAEGVATKVLAALREPFRVGEAAVNIGGSIGIALYPANGADGDALLAAADGAMYQAKANGKNIWSCAIGMTTVVSPMHRHQFEWRQEYESGNAEIDRQHRHMVAMINELARRFTNGDDADSVWQYFREFFDYTRLHFATEEGLMAKYAIEGAGEHAQRHRELERSLAGLRDHIEERGPSLALRSLKDWMLDHVVKFDRRLAAALPPGAFIHDSELPLACRPTAAAESAKES